MLAGAPEPALPRRSSTRRKVAFTAVVLALGAGAVYAVWVAARATRFYWHVKTHQRGMSDGLVGPDEALGFAPAPDAQGALVFPVGPDVPTRSDANGFRIPASFPGTDATRGPRPLVLALGCSFTYGDGGLAEEAFPHLVASAFHGTELDAGGCAWGLAQMLLRARALIPRHRPDLTLVQFSPWLIERACTPLAPTFVAAAPQPYFVDAPGGPALHSPAFAPYVARVDGFRATPPGTTDELSFVARVGIPLFLHDDLHLASLRARTALGLLPRGTRDGDAVVERVYREIGELCVESRSSYVVLIVGGEPTPAQRAALVRSGALLVDGQAALGAALADTRPEAFERAYGIWRGSPPVLVDPHPNAAAHRILADAVIGAIARRLSGH